MIDRVRPCKDTFTVGGLIRKNNGQDEILELGYSDLAGTEGSSRILIAFNVNKSENYKQHSHRVVLNLKEVRSENLANPCTLDVFAVSSDWIEGTGHISDDPHTTDGTCRYEEPEMGQYVGSVSFTPEDSSLDFSLDVTGFVDSSEKDQISFLIKLSDEDSAESLGTRVMYYGVNTHTCSWPYLDFEVDDSFQESKLPIIDSSPFRLTVFNLPTECRKGETIRVDVNPVPVYPIRQFTTSSLYRVQCRVPESLSYSLVDEYTGECVLDSGLGTRVSSDNSGSFIMLQTDMLEPERYYRLVFVLGEQEKTKYQLVQNRHTFRVARSWKVR